MCGIAGIIGLSENTAIEKVNIMNLAMKHRGPDATGLYSDEDAVLGHVRLSIIDLSQGADQPLKEASDRYIIVFNGEIYNYESVKAELEYDWKTSSDTEVILAAYMKWGKECLEKLNGMFAFAIWDKQVKSLFMARDRMGIKPFYYSFKNGIFSFASEMRCLLSAGLSDKKISRPGLFDYLNKIAVKTPETIIQDIHQLRPGYYAVFKEGKLEEQAFWNLLKPIRTQDIPKSREEAVEKVRDLFDQSIKSRLVADVPVGAFLSGGIDSSAAVAFMAKNSREPIRTFSIVFDEKEYDESEYAQMIAKKYQTEHTEITLKPSKLIESLPSFFNSLDSPTVDGINTFLVSEMVGQKGIKVVVTGLGGDELFAGYKNFKRWMEFKKYGKLIMNPLAKAVSGVASKVVSNRIVSKVRDLQSQGGSDFGSFYNNSRSIFMNAEIESLLPGQSTKGNQNLIDLNSKDLSKWPVLSQYSLAEMSNYTLDVLIKDTDQMSMAWALEVREPFFDYHLVEYVMGVPDEFKFSEKTPKSLLVDAMGEDLPPEIVYRPKKGFSFPWDYWLRNELKDYCETAIQKLSERNLFETKALLNFWKRFLEHDKSVTWTHIWAFVVLENWISLNHISTEE